MIAEIEDSSGRIFRWSGNERSSQDIPQGITFRTQRGDGFADMSCTLTRRIDRDYPDLNLFDTIRLVGDDGTVAYEGRINSNPRSLDDAGHNIQVEATGWMTHARDRTFQEVYVDRDLGAWGDSSSTYKASLLAANYNVGSPTTEPDPTTGIPALMLVAPISVWVSPYKPMTTALYDAGSGVTVASVYYDVAAATNALNSLYLGSAADADSSSAEVTGNFGGGGSSGTFIPTTARRFMRWELFHSVTPAGNDGAQFAYRISRLAVFGSHGLTKRGSAPDQGYYASDMLKNIAQRFCPRLDTTNVNDTTYNIGQAAWKTATQPYDAFLDLNSFHDWELNVWEDRKLYYHTPTSLDDYDWEVRLDDPGVRVQLEGDSTERLANGVVVVYTDLILGTQQTVTPEDDTTLADTTESNPANTHGIDKWITVEVPFPTLEGDAVQWGRAALAQFNTPSSPGRISIRGHIRDRQGNWQPGWKVKAGERVVISDHPNDRARRITGTTWNHDSRSMDIEVEQDQRRLEVIAARIARARTAAGLG